MEFRLEDESGLYLFAFLFLGGTRYTRLLKEEYCEYCISLARTISSKALRDKHSKTTYRVLMHAFLITPSERHPMLS
jgi:hypothetical protein